VSRSGAAAPVVTALFVAAASPGMVFRWLERRADGCDGLARLDALGLLLSDARGPDQWRALLATTDEPGASRAWAARAWMEATGPALAHAFPPSVTLLRADEDERVWGYVVWPADSGVAPERGGGGVAPPPSLWRRLAGLGGDGPAARAAAWARARGLPVDRAPGLAVRRSLPLPVHDYATVAGLDARGLLREDSPRLYRLRFRADVSPGKD